MTIVAEDLDSDDEEMTPIKTYVVGVGAPRKPAAKRKTAARKPAAKRKTAARKR